MRGRASLVVAALTLLATACRAEAPAPAAAPPPAAQPAAAGASSPSSPPRHLTVALSAISAIVAPVWVAVDEGLFRKHGLEVEIANLDGGSRAVAAIVSGDAPIGVLNAGSVVDARLQGTDVLVLAGLFDTYYFQIYSRPEIRSPAELRGRTIAASGARAASERAIIDALEPYGLEPGRDYQLTYVGSQSGRLAALEQGLVDATIIAPPFGLKAREAGFNELINLVTLGIPFGHFVVASSESWIRANPDTVRAFLRAYVESLALVKRDREATKRAISRYTDTTDPALLEESYQAGIPQLPDIPWVREEIIRGALATSENPRARDAAPQTFYDNRYLQELEASGFFRELHGR
ncbi:MAG TPA: ABC transporter substrate-binding protein [Chloroflexota bacterium]|nr:ABC transporter substrate-binding protein [Chloroflexota bacterium]